MAITQTSVSDLTRKEIGNEHKKGQEIVLRIRKTKTKVKTYSAGQQQQ